jgi:hypothetical protein
VIKGVSQNFRSKKDQILHVHMTIFEMSHRMLTYCNHGDNDFHQKKKKNHGDNDDDDASGSHVVNLSLLWPSMYKYLINICN